MIICRPRGILYIGIINSRPLGERKRNKVITLYSPPRFRSCAPRCILATYMIETVFFQCGLNVRAPITAI